MANLNILSTVWALAYPCCVCMSILLNCETRTHRRPRDTVDIGVTEETADKDTFDSMECSMDRSLLATETILLLYNRLLADVAQLSVEFMTFIATETVLSARLLLFSHGCRTGKPSSINATYISFYDNFYSCFLTCAANDNRLDKRIPKSSRAHQRDPVSGNDRDLPIPSTTRQRCSINFRWHCAAKQDSQQLWTN